MAVLSKAEIARLLDASSGGGYDLLRRCALAVLNSGSEIDDGEQMLAQYPDFHIEPTQQDRGLRVELRHAPARAFVDGRIILGIKEHLFAVLRDIVHIQQMLRDGMFDLDTSAGISDAVFSLLRHGGVLCPGVDPNLVVCWGGHSISREEYDYTKEVGYQLGLRGADICTGCGPGAMKGPMKGATIAHAKQRQGDGRYIGISEPGIIAAESPNPIVNQLLIMPDIEKRLEAFVRLAHTIVVFPGGVGTAEEILFLLGVLSHPDNEDVCLPLIFTGPASSEMYFRKIDAFIRDSMGSKAANRYRIIIDDPPQVARSVMAGIKQVRQTRIQNKDAFFFNWLLKLDERFQKTFDATHENMAALDLRRDLPPHEIAANLRCAFSGIVSGNVKPEGIRAIRQHGKFRLKGDPDLMATLDELLQSFVEQHRMKLPGSDYHPCYVVERV